MVSTYSNVGIYIFKFISAYIVFLKDVVKYKNLNLKYGIYWSNYTGFVERYINGNYYYYKEQHGWGIV